MTAQIFGFLLAMYFLVGRWSLDRLEGTTATGTLMDEPRFWVVAAMLPVVLLLRPKMTRQELRARPTPVDYSICVFLGYMLLTSLWAPSAELAFDKAVELSLILAVAVLIAASRYTLAHAEIQHGFWCMIVLVGIAMASLAILYSTSGRVHVPGGGPNTFGRNMGLMALGAVYLAAAYGRAARPACVAAILVAMLMILLCGSRGALLSSSMGAFVLLLTAREALAKKIAAAAAVSLLGAALILSTSAGQNALETFHERIIHTTFERHHLAGREDLWLDAVDWIVERRWFGWGLNGYRANNGIYPHNLFLEVTMEGGLVGLLLLINVGRVWWHRCWRYRLQLSRPVLGAFALAFTAAQTSGDLFDSRGVFLMLALATPPRLVLPARSQLRRRARRVNPRRTASTARVAHVLPRR